METQDNITIENGDNIINTATAFDYSGRCPLRVHIEDGKITRVEPDDHKIKKEQFKPSLRC